MGVICTKCNYTNVDGAKFCQNCGNPLTQVENDSKVAKTNIARYKCINGGEEIVFDNGLEEGASGSFKCDGETKGYTIKEGFIIVNGNPHYLLYENYIFLLLGLAEYYADIPDDERFDGKFRFEKVIGGFNMQPTYDFFFSKDGSFEKNVPAAAKGIWRYKRFNNIIVTYNTHTEHMDYFIGFGTTFYTTYAGKCTYVKENSEEEKLIEPITNFVADVKNQTKVPIPGQSIVSTPTTPKVTCPYCKSDRTKKIGTISRGFSFGLFGFGSSKVGKQWHCNDCNSDF